MNQSRRNVESRRGIDRMTGRRRIPTATGNSSLFADCAD